MNTCWSSRSPYGPEHNTQSTCDLWPLWHHPNNTSSSEHGVTESESSSLTSSMNQSKESSPISVPALQPPCPSTSSRLRILKEVSGVEPGWVEIIPLKRVTVHVLTWLLSAQTDSQQTHKVRDALTGLTEEHVTSWGHRGDIMRSAWWHHEVIAVPEIRCFSDSMILVTGLRWTEKVWKSCGPEPTVSGCWTMTRTVPELVPYAISIQFPLSPDHRSLRLNTVSFMIHFVDADSWQKHVCLHVFVSSPVDDWRTKFLIPVKNFIFVNNSPDLFCEIKFFPKMFFTWIKTSFEKNLPKIVLRKNVLNFPKHVGQFLWKVLFSKFTQKFFVKMFFLLLCEKFFLTFMWKKREKKVTWKSFFHLSETIQQI